MKNHFVSPQAWLHFALPIATTLTIAATVLLLDSPVSLAQEHMDTVTAELQPKSGSKVEGTLKFMEHGSKVRITGQVRGLTPGKHGIHIHTNGNCDTPDALSAGGHFSPYGGRHNAPTSNDRHLGDLGNIVAGADGIADVDIVTEGVTLALMGTHSIIDRAIVIHANEDDFSDPAGNSGARIACGLIDQSMMRM